MSYCDSWSYDDNKIRKNFVCYKKFHPSIHLLALFQVQVAGEAAQEEKPKLLKVTPLQHMWGGVHSVFRK